MQLAVRCVGVGKCRHDAGHAHGAAAAGRPQGTMCPIGQAPRGVVCVNLPVGATVAIWRRGVIDVLL